MDSTEAEITGATKASRKERFEIYLDKTGAKAAIIRALVCLYEDENKPNDPIHYLCEQWGLRIPENKEVQALQAEVIDRRARLDLLREENQRLSDEVNRIAEVEEHETGLDDDVQEMLRKQADQLSRIQRREACILKRREEMKAKEQAQKQSYGICLPDPMATQKRDKDREEEESNFPGPPPATPELKCSASLELVDRSSELSDCDFDCLKDGFGGHGDELHGEDCNDIEEAFWGEDYDGTEVGHQGDGDISLVESGMRTIMIPMEELKNHSLKRYHCT